MNAGFLPKDFTILKISFANGVFPVPPTYILPTQIMGISALLIFLNDWKNFDIENKIEYITENG